jgi:hypothetical protein
MWRYCGLFEELLTSREGSCKFNLKNDDMRKIKPELIKRFLRNLKEIK